VFTSYSALSVALALPADDQLLACDISDADKASYDAYYERYLKLVRCGGLIAIDNTLWSGAVASPSTDTDTLALQALNLKLHRDERVDLSLLPFSDGLTLARRR
jgi:predicted O-methyltransferase YrrM